MSFLKQRLRVPVRTISIKRFLLYYSKKVFHHLIFTTFLGNDLYKYTKNIFKYTTAVEGLTHCLTQQYICLETFC